MAVQSKHTSGRSGRDVVECHGDQSSRISEMKKVLQPHFVLLQLNSETKSLAFVDFSGNHDEDEMNSRNVGTKQACCGEIINRRARRQANV